ncbi:MAG: hypothetical protein HZY74_06675 [Brevundimonas sp.]|nr:MAG: hypothetical protein HZY74_06675 [Brevundimonas sp.]
MRIANSSAHAVAWGYYPSTSGEGGGVFFNEAYMAARASLPRDPTHG